MATNIPPHNLNEVCTALIKLLDNEDISNAQLCRYVKGPDFPTGGQILNSPDELKEIYRTGSGSIRLRGTWDIGPETQLDEDDLHREHPLHGEQVAAGRTHRRRRPGPQAAATARREGPLHRGRADRARDEEGRRREDDHGVPLQAHAAADQLRGEPHVPGAGGAEPRGRPARAARPETDPLALPPLPPRGRDPAARTRARRAQQANPHPRRIREGLRRARRDHQDHSQVGRQGRRRPDDHEAVRARRGSDRRDPRAEDLPPRAGSKSSSSATSSRTSASGRGRSTRCCATSRAAGRWSATSSKR